MLVGILLAPETPTDDAFCRNVSRSASSWETLIVARMWVVSVPATLSWPTTDGSLSQSNGWMPSLPSAPEPDPPLGEDATPAKLDSSFWNVAAGSW